MTIPTPDPRPPIAARPGWRAIMSEPVMLSAAFALAGAIWLFFLAVDAMRGADTPSADDRIMDLVRELRTPGAWLGDRAWLTEIAHDLSALGRPVVVTIVVVSLAGYLGIRRSCAAMWTILIVSLSGAALALVLKVIFGRPRPDSDLHLAFVTGDSFPSFHSIVSAVVYVTLGAMVARLTPSRLGKAYVLVFAMAVVVAVGISRVYLGVHYPSDVVGGWAAGVAWALVCWMAARWRFFRGLPRHPTRPAAPPAIRAAESLLEYH
jgi:undecaprenyl-diphosphatase